MKSALGNEMNRMRKIQFHRLMSTIVLIFEKWKIRRGKCNANFEKNEV